MTILPSRPWAGMAMKWAPSMSNRGRKWIQGSAWQGKEGVGRDRHTSCESNVLGTFGL